MEAARNYLDDASPSNSYRYLYYDHGQHLDARHSEPQSSVTSPHDMAFPGEFSGTSAFPSPESRDADDGSDSPHELSATTDTSPKSAAKRKRENRYKNAPPSVLSRRRAQNRASQRAYRERKDQRIKDLELMLSDERVRNDMLSQAYAELHTEHDKCKSPPPPPPHQHQPHPPHHHPPPHHPPGPLSSSSAPPPSPHHLGAAAAAAHHGHHNHHHQLVSSMAGPASSHYPSMAGASVSGDLGPAYVDATSMAVLEAGMDLEAYLYPAVPGYPL